MKFFHLSDLHIGKQLHYYSLAEDQRHILDQVVEWAKREQPQAVVIAGDVYDKAIPSGEAVSLFDYFLTELTKALPEGRVLVIAGNHDSPRRLDFASSILEKHQVHIVGMPPKSPEEYLTRVSLEDAWGEVCFYLMPFLKPGYVAGVFPEEEKSSYQEAIQGLLEREQIDTGIRNVLITHQFYTSFGREPRRSDSEAIHVGGLDNVDVQVLTPFDYVAMGHIHRPQSIGGEQYRYAGTLLPYSVSEAGDEKVLTMVTLGEKKTPPQVTELPLSPLRRVIARKGTLDELLARAGEEPCEDYASLTITDEIMPYQLREQLERKYTRILELKIENTRTLRQAGELQECSLVTEPLPLFARFYEELQGQPLREEQKALLKDVIDTIKEGGE